MKTIHLRTGPDGLLHPVLISDTLLMQHFMNEDLIAITRQSLDKLRFIAELHGVGVNLDGKPA